MTRRTAKNVNKYSKTLASLKEQIERTTNMLELIVQEQAVLQQQTSRRSVAARFLSFVFLVVIVQRARSAESKQRDIERVESQLRTVHRRLEELRRQQLVTQRLSDNFDVRAFRRSCVRRVAICFELDQYDSESFLLGAKSTSFCSY